MKLIDHRGVRLTKKFTNLPRVPVNQQARTEGPVPDRVRRVSVTDPIAAARRHDYADAFELRLKGPDRCSPDGDHVVLEDSDALMDTVMVGRNVEPERRVLTTVLRYRRPLLARAVWAFVGILHRRTARQVVAGGLRHVEVPDGESALAKAERLGGTRTMGPDQVPGRAGDRAVEDPDGKTVGVVQAD